MTIELHLTRVDHGEAQFGEGLAELPSLAGALDDHADWPQRDARRGSDAGGDHVGPSWCTVQRMSVSGW